jgi:glycosyltransferase involved in cell wall biosynthesis
MRIAIDGRYIHDHFPGIGRYTYNLIRGLANAVRDDTVVVVHNPDLPNSRYDIAALGSLPNIELARTASRPFSLAEQWQMPQLARRLKVDVWHAPYYIGPYLLPCPLVVTVHDAISSRYPQYLPSRAARFSYEVTMRLAMLAARQVIAVSRASYNDLERFFAVPPAKLTVVYEGADESYEPQSARAIENMRNRLHLPPRYALYLGMNKPHKNVTRLIEAWGLVQRKWHALDEVPGLPPLIMAGRSDPRYGQARETAERLSLGDSVRFLGDVAEADLPALYSGAMLFVFPSLYEGFGLPVLEAMACGAPVVCSTTPALLETAGDAALTVNPLDVQALAQAMLRVLTSTELRHDLSQRGRKQAARFEWERAAAETLQVYRAAGK